MQIKIQTQKNSHNKIKELKIFCLKSVKASFDSLEYIPDSSRLKFSNIQSSCPMGHNYYYCDLSGDFQLGIFVHMTEVDKEKLQSVCSMIFSCYKTKTKTKT